MRENKFRIAILVATYNGEKYIEEQIKSLQKQTVSNINIIINDDMSNDKTFSKLKQFVEKDSRIKISQVKCGGACENFLYLMRENRDYDWFFFCDQDDVWHPQKVEILINAVSAQSQTMPLLAYCDKEIVDENLKFLNIEDYDFQDEFKNILFQNHIYGCAMMINKALTDKLLCLSNIAMHDHGAALIAVLEGKIIHVRKKLVKYRQHANNVTGGINQFSYKRKILHWNEVNRNQMKTFQMCRKICDLYKDKSNVAKMYLRMLDSNKYMRVVRAIKYGFRRNGFLPTLRAYLVMMQYNKLVDYFYDRT